MINWDRYNTYRCCAVSLHVQDVYHLFGSGLEGGMEFEGRKTILDHLHHRIQMLSSFVTLLRSLSFTLHLLRDKMNMSSSDDRIVR